MSTTCRSCGRALGEGDRFCPGCGTTVDDPMETAAGQTPTDQGTNPTQCVSCGAPMGRDDRFCPKCGSARPEEATVVSHVSLRNTQAAHLIEATAGEFEIVRQLGTGAMGAVYLAKDVALGRDVAIKIIAPNLLSDDTMVSRFRLEAQTVAALRHPNIVNVHAVRQSDDLHFFVMEFIDGPPLRSIIKEHAPLDVDVVQALLFQVGSALSYAHRTRGGVIHRDIKPANIMVDREGSAFVTDFGISKIAEAQTGLTQTGATIGTPEYMSPEQCRGEALTGASDQYALGIVAYEMLTGGTPFSGNQYHIMVAHTSEPPAPIREARPDVPVQVASAVERMLAKTPQERWPDLDGAVSAMGGAPLPYKSPVRNKIVALTGATLINVPALDTGSSGPVTADTATSVTVTGLPPVIETGDSFTLEADVRGTGETSLTGLGVVWASTDPSIARVEGGVVHALKPGTVSITATAGNVANSVLLTVAEPSPAAVLVRPGSVRIQRGGRIGLSAVVHDKKGREMERAVGWRSSDPSIATVTEDGQVEATGSGSVSIVAVSEGVTGTADIVVEAPAAATTPVAPAAPTTTPDAEAPSASPSGKPPATEPEKEAAASAGAGPGAPPAAKPEPESPVRPGTGRKPSVPKEPAAPKPKGPDRPAASTPPKPSYATTPDKPPLFRRPAVIAASVIAVLLIGGGVVMMSGGEDAPAVAPAPVADGGGAAVGADPTTPPGQTAEAPGQPDGPDGTEPAGGAPDGPGAGTEPPEPEPVEPDPTTTADGGAPPAGGDTPPPADTQPPPATTPEPEPTPPPAAPPTPARVEVALASTAMAVGGSQSASAQVYSGNGSPLSSGFRLAWRSSDPDVLAVDARGNVRGVGAGTAWVVATAGRASDSTLVSIAAVVDAVEIAGSDLSLEVGDTRTLSASVRDAQGNALERSVSWSSSNPAVVAVDPSTGAVRAADEGTAQVTAAADGFTDEVTLTVAAPAPALPTTAAVRSALDGYVAALAAGDEDAVRRLWGGDEDGLEDLLDTMDEREFSAALQAVGDPAGQGGAASVPFAVRGSYRNFAGGSRTTDFSLVARFERSGPGWALVSVATGGQ